MTKIKHIFLWSLQNSSKINSVQTFQETNTTVEHATEIGIYNKSKEFTKIINLNFRMLLQI